MLQERNILKALLPSLAAFPGVALGPGDDCAALEIPGENYLLAAVDQLIAHVHFDPAATPPGIAGAKLMKRNLSDIAAMGGVPRWALLSVAAAGRDPEWVLAFCRGAAEAGVEWGVPVVGGDLAGLPEPGVAASLSILGEVAKDRMVLRSGARPGDFLYVTGCCGNSFESGHHLSFRPRLREGRFLGENRFASAMLDISDGLLLDALRLAERSGRELLLDPRRVPLREGATAETALRDGEDYELLFTVPQDRAAELEERWPAEFAPLARIGAAREGAPRVVDPSGRILSENGVLGYEH